MQHLPGFIRQAEQQPTATAFVIRGETISYGDFALRVTAIQQQLQAEHAGQQFFGIDAIDHIDTYAAIMALLLLGKTYVPLHPQYPAVRYAQIIGQAGIQTIWSADPGDFIERCPSPVKVEDTNALKAHTAALTYQESTGQVAYILFTSGSTGVPKGVPITYKNIQAFLDGLEHMGVKLSSSDRCLQMFDLTFDLSVMSYLAPLVAGASVYTVPEGEIKFMAVYRILETYELTCALMVPSVLTYLRPYLEDIDLPAMRYSLFCGEALYQDAALQWQKSVPGARVWNVYGPTEATIFCTYSPIGDHLAYNGIVSIGQSMHHVQCLVLDEQNQIAAAHTKGELCLGGAQVTPGYLNNPGKNAEAFVQVNGQRFYRTGDIAYSDENGNLFYCGRKDQQIKVNGGFRVELNEVEHHARTCMPGHALAAVAIPQENGISIIGLCIEQYTGPEDQLIQDLREYLPDYMLPARIISLEQLPLNDNGKIDRKALLHHIISGEAAN